MRDVKTKRSNLHSEFSFSPTYQRFILLGIAREAVTPFGLLSSQIPKLTFEAKLTMPTEIRHVAFQWRYDSSYFSTLDPIFEIKDRTDNENKVPKFALAIARNLQRPQSWGFHNETHFLCYCLLTSCPKMATIK